MTKTETQIGDEIHAALTANGCTTDLANWLVDLALRVRRIEATLKIIQHESRGDEK